MVACLLKIPSPYKPESYSRAAPACRRSPESASWVLRTCHSTSTGIFAPRRSRRSRPSLWGSRSLRNCSNDMIKIKTSSAQRCHELMSKVLSLSCFSRCSRSERRRSTCCIRSRSSATTAALPAFADDGAPLSDGMAALSSGWRLKVVLMSFTYLMFWNIN